MKKSIITLSIILLSFYVRAQEHITIDTVNRFVYLVSVSEKKIFKDKTFAYPGNKTFQISSPVQLSKSDVLLRVKKKLDVKKINDTAFIDKSFLYLDDLVNPNEIKIKEQLRPVYESAVTFKKSSIKNHREKLGSKDYLVSIKLITGSWWHLKLPKEILYKITGSNTAQYFDQNSNKLADLFIVKELLASEYL
ncbi:hypothetical protein [Sediminibacterium ginsengisoli]|uniref:GLPGLI family protein n=1 Tax=Sediminibacterium ginsengisoli TaxID=413434 RepID=A0A1T4P379_9BACT|nr:hypothetical protein [Sediminibacterium ginsengisoli]SJZ85851.1 hypothetical protein SAMN04488132_105120 [Sediminibacterium ginsengisoli]